MADADRDVPRSRLLVFPSRLVPVAGAAILIALFLMLVARPVAVFTALGGARLGWREKAFLSWVGLRGAVPIVLATFPYLAGLPKADLYFNVVFFIVLTSVLLQGTTLGRAARWLQLDEPAAPPQEHEMEIPPGSELVSLTASGLHGDKRIMELGLPESALVVLVKRGRDHIAPRGGTTIQRGDTLLVLADKRDVPAVRTLIE